ncbi:MAG: VanZ family protein, partial [Candidatus Electrothrix sp. AW2]|nr:VanZ family protein [Candidatus Electrothrix gigas]
QPLVNRYGEWLDMAANTAGVGGGILVAQIVRQWVREEPGKI